MPPGTLHARVYKLLEKNKAEIKENYKALNKCMTLIKLLFINK